MHSSQQVYQSALKGQGWNYAPYKGLSIRLNYPDFPGSLHTNGDRVSGEVTFVPLNTYDCITVLFKGELTTTIETGSNDNRTTHRGSASLFEFSTTIHYGSVLTKAQSWPFEFEFPTEARPATHKKPVTPHKNFLHEPGHQLPPSWEHTSGTRSQSVMYYIEVVGHNPSAFIHTTVKCRLPVYFSPARMLLHPPLEPSNRTSRFTRTTRKLDPILAAQPQSFGEKTRRFFRGPETPDPTAVFSITTSVPTQVYAGGPLSVSMGIQHDLTRSTALETPPVYLINFHARLTWLYDIRVSSKALFGDSNITSQNKGKIDLVNRSGLHELMYEHMDLEGSIRSMKIPDETTPTFLSYLIGLQYKLKVTAVILCAEKTYEILLANDFVLILPYPYKPSPGQLPDVPPPIQLEPEYQENERVDDPLPPYERYETQPPTVFDRIGVARTGHDSEIIR